MNASIFKLSLVVLFSIISIQSCEMLTGKDECEGSSMDLIEPVIYLKIAFSAKSSEIVPGTFLNNAEEMIITGSIQKEYCDGKLSGNFTYNPTFFPQTMTSEDWENGLYFPQPYQYKFSNKEDELIVILNIKAYATDGRIYESVELVSRYKYTDINYDVNMLRKYILIYSSGNLGWIRVTS